MLRAHIEDSDTYVQVPSPFTCVVEECTRQGRAEDCHLFVLAAIRRYSIVSATIYSGFEHSIAGHTLFPYRSYNLLLSIALEFR